MYYIDKLIRLYVYRNYMPNVLIRRYICLMSMHFRFFFSDEDQLTTEAAISPVGDKEVRFMLNIADIFG